MRIRKNLRKEEKFMKERGRAGREINFSLLDLLGARHGTSQGGKIDIYKEQCDSPRVERAL